MSWFLRVLGGPAIVHVAGAVGSQAAFSDAMSMTKR